MKTNTAYGNTIGIKTFMVIMFLSIFISYSVYILLDKTSSFRVNSKAQKILKLDAASLSMIDGSIGVRNAFIQLIALSGGGEEARDAIKVTLEKSLPGYVPQFIPLVEDGKTKEILVIWHKTRAQKAEKEENSVE